MFESSGLLLTTACGAAVLAVLVTYWVTKHRFKKILQKTQREARLAKREASEQTKQMQSFLEAISASPDGIVILDDEWRIQWCNAVGARLLRLDLSKDANQQLPHLVRDPKLITYLAQADYSHELILPESLSLKLHPVNQGYLLLIRDMSANERAELSRRDFVANVSHEIRTPLTVILGYVQTLQ